MKQINYYKKLGLTSPDEIFEHLINTLKDSIYTWDYFTDFEKSISNAEKYKKELNQLNELINEVLRKCSVMINEKNIKVYFENKEPIYVYADEFYMDQIITNYLTNAIKHAEEVEKETKIEIKVEKVSNKIRVSVFNTGENIPEEDLQRIWGRFYKLDSSRNRQDGGSGIGLALVKAIMNNYQNEYGVKNKKNGVEFYFDMDISD